MRLKNRSAIITGASRGIGRAIERAGHVVSSIIREAASWPSACR